MSVRVNLRKTLFILPNLFTLSSIFCGFYAMLLCIAEPSEESFYRASILIVFAAFFDTLDGRVARLTKTQSAFGVQIDSLADVVSFGAAPAVLVYQWSLHSMGMGGAIVAFAFLACGAIRLARFNVLTTGTAGAPKKPSKYIVGMPIPGAAGILVALIVANHAVAGHLASSPAIIVAIVSALAFFMVSTIRFRSFKDVRMSRRTVILVTLAATMSLGVALRFHVSFALVGLATLYVAFALGEAVVRLGRRGLGVPVDEEEEEREAR